MIAEYPTIINTLLAKNDAAVIDADNLFLQKLN